MNSDVQISEVDPLDPANEPVLHAMWDVSAAARADRPFEVWAPWTTAYATWTTVRDDQDDVMWAATVDGVVVGMAGVVMSHVDNQHVADDASSSSTPTTAGEASAPRCSRRSSSAAARPGGRC